MLLQLLCSGFDKWCTEGIDLALFLWDFLIVPGRIYVLDEEQTVTRPALSGNNIHLSRRHFLRSDKEIPPLIKYVGKKIHIFSFRGGVNKRHWGNNKYSDSLFLFTALFLQYKQALSGFIDTNYVTKTKISFILWPKKSENLV